MIVTNTPLSPSLSTENCGAGEQTQRRLKMLNPKTISIAEYARAKGHPLSYVYAMVWSGKLPAEKLGRVWRIKVSEIENQRGRTSK
jgi:excisionase family DNA binding protein